MVIISSSVSPVKALHQNMYLLTAQKLNSEVRKLMNVIGLKNFSGVAFNYVMKDITKDDFTMDLYFSGMIKDKLIIELLNYNLKEFFAIVLPR